MFICRSVAFIFFSKLRQFSSFMISSTDIKFMSVCESVVTNNNWSDFFTLLIGIDHGIHASRCLGFFVGCPQRVSKH